MGKNRNEQESYTRYVGFDQLISYDASGRQEYVGLAYPVSANASATPAVVVGPASTDSAWSIFKITYDGSGRMTSRRYADGTDDFDKVWDDRATYTYA